MQVRTAFVACLLVAMPGIAYAHPSGVSFMQETEGYTIDIGYSPTTFTTEENALFDFLFLQGLETVPYDHVWVRIIRDGRTVFAGGIRKQVYGPTSLLYRFPSAGEYVLEASYRTQDGETIASAEFSFDVQRGTDASPNWYAVGGTVGAVIVGAFVGLALRRRRSQ